MGKQEEAAKRLKEREAASKKRFKLPEGDTTFRVLPNAKGLEKKEFAEYAMHSNVGPKKSYIRCGKNSEGEGDCWLCDEVIPKLEASEKASKRKAAEEMARGEKFAIQIAVLNGDTWAGPYLWEMPNSLANSLLGMLAKRDIANPEKGYNITVSRTGTGFTSTKYGALERDDAKSAAPEKVLARLKPFGEVLKKYDEDAMKAAYYGHEQEEEEDETPSKKIAPVEEEEDAPPPKKPKAPVVEEEEEEDVPPPKKTKKPVVEEEEEETPAPKKTKKPVVDEDDELEAALADDADVPDLDEEDAPPPKKLKKPVVEEEEEETPAPKKPKKPVVEEEEEDAAPPPKKPKKPAADDDDY